MADKDGLKIAKDYHVNEAFANQGGFYVKGANNLDWGMNSIFKRDFETVAFPMYPFYATFGIAYLLF